MVNINTYILQLIVLLQNQFGARLLYVGLQGSYLRGEATDSSDIDIMVVIDELSVSDLTTYRSIIESLPHANKSCGFICSKVDLENWNPLEICHVLNSTKDYFGVLAQLIPTYNEQDIRNFVKMSINNLYHEICHRYIHSNPENNIASLPYTYKGTFFILQNLYYLRHGDFIATKAALLSLLDGCDHAVLKRSMEFSRKVPCDFERDFELLFTWCQETLKTL